MVVSMLGTLSASRSDTDVQVIWWWIYHRINVKLQMRGQAFVASGKLMYQIISTYILLLCSYLTAGYCILVCCWYIDLIVSGG